MLDILTSKYLIMLYETLGRYLTLLEPFDPSLYIFLYISWMIHHKRQDPLKFYNYAFAYQCKGQVTHLANMELA